AVHQDTTVQASKTYFYRAQAYTVDNVSAYTSEIPATAVSTPSGSGGGGGGGCFLRSLLAD
ncbi:MAG: hypothetical protein MUC57_07720, partial [Desulfobacterales bacterium]|nr:hypothetical protein [Desulfobacterales bacterium]